MMKYQNAANKMAQFVTVKSLIWPWGQSSRSKVTKYEKRQKNYSPDTICYGRTDQFNLEVKGHQQLYATHRLEVVYLHAKYAKPVLNDKNVTARTRFVTDGRTDGRTDWSLKGVRHKVAGP